MNRLVLPLLLVASAAFGQSDLVPPDRAEAPSAEPPASVEPAASVETTAGDPAIRHLLFLGSKRPWVAEVRMHVARKPHRETWEAWVTQRFESLDANDDGHLDGEEMGGLVRENNPSPASALLNFFGNGAREAVITGDADGDGMVTRDELAAHYRGDRQGPFAVESGNDTSQTSPSTVSSRLARALDSDDDTALSGEELAAALATTADLDQNEDELLGTSELAMQNQNYYVDSDSRNAATYDDVVDLPLAEGPELASLIRRLELRYRGPKAQKPGLARWELKWSKPGVFERFDADASGRLEEAELVAYLFDPVCDVRITVRFDSRRWWTTPPKDAPPTFVVEGLDGTQQKPVQVSKVSGDRRRVVTGGDSIEFLPPQSLDQNERNLVSNFESQFGSADGDNNEYLEQDEADRYYMFNGLFDDLDADRDGKVFMPELRTFLQRELGSARSRTRLIVADRGRNLFDLMDGNRNGTITPRELVTGRERGLRWDGDKDGKLADGEIPRFLRLAFRPGQPNFRNAQYLVGTESIGGSYGQGRRNVPNAPAWFAGMDRNGDGDVSRREFLGPIEDFDRLDSDGDDLLSAEESSRLEPAEKTAAANRE